MYFKKSWKAKVFWVSSEERALQTTVPITLIPLISGLLNSGPTPTCLLSSHCGFGGFRVFLCTPHDG